MTSTRNAAAHDVHLEADDNTEGSGRLFMARTATPWLKVQFTGGIPAGRWISLAYKMSMRNARSYFYARQFPMVNKDILYVSAAPLNEVQKILAMIGQVTGLVSTGAFVRSSVRN